MLGLGNRERVPEPECSLQETLEDAIYSLWERKMSTGPSFVINSEELTDFFEKMILSNKLTDKVLSRLSSDLMTQVSEAHR
ncbi:hypothetical protein GOP47_0012741 [Adiantum capillus-veneris]|uniref:Uncharacterized protein n=1 Tax=Adiantum capillus-veneris TaxID=13818 RepID=A0A9D4URM5_ADICA|nr:hypothetical protein GOP47_0012741 [Adiantum capillus-veneris]